MKAIIVFIIIIGVCFSGTIKYIEDYSTKWGVDSRIVKSLIIYESSGVPDKISKAGAVGLMMVTPEIAREYWKMRHKKDGKKIAPVMMRAPDSFYKRYLKIESVNICIGCWELSRCLKKAKGNYVKALNFYINGKNTKRISWEYINNIINKIINLE